MKLKLVRLGLLAVVVLVVVGAGLIGWNAYRRARARYDMFRARIQPGVTIAGLDVGGLTPAEAEQRVKDKVAAPYFRDFSLVYQGESLSLSPAADLGLAIPTKDLAARAMEGSHQYDYWSGFWQWIKGSIPNLSLDIPLEMSHDPAAARRFMDGVARTHDRPAVEPMVDMQRLSFLPGRPGRRLEVDAAAQMVDERVDKPEQRALTLPVEPVEPDQSPARIESMISTLGPVMERAPGPPRFYTATLPISTTAPIEATPRVTYTGELTWTFPYMGDYTGPLTTTYAFFFDPGEPGLTFDVQKAVTQVEEALLAGVTTPITFQPDWLAPPPMKTGVLVEPLKARLARFPGVTTMLLKNLDTGQMIYDSNSKYVLSGMSIVKIGIMVEVYRYYDGQIGPQTHQELLDMLGSSSCNPCANRLMATVGGGSSTAGAQRVSATMQKLGLPNFRICGPFQVVDAPSGELYAGPVRRHGGASVAVAAAGWGSFAAYLTTPRYDRCVKTTTAEMARLVEMIYQGTKGKGTLVQSYPKITPEDCQEMIDIMASNDLRNMLGSGIPSDVKLAHKHGFSGYAVPWGDTRGEVGIIFSPKATLLISFYIWQDTEWINWGINQPLYRDVSNMIYNFFNYDRPFWPEPPWAPEEDE